MYKNLVILIVLVLSTSNLFAITIGTAKKPPDGMYLVNFTAYYEADVLTGSDSQDRVKNFGAEVLQNVLWPVYYKDNFVYYSKISVMQKKISFLNYNEKGLTDIEVAMGYFFSTKSTDIAPVIKVTLPTGKFDVGAASNLGDGVYSFTPQVFINHRFAKKFMLDGVLKYRMQEKNNDTGIKNGNRFTFETVLAYMYSQRLMFGPALSYVRDESKTRNGSTVANSDTSILKAGFDINYPLTKTVGFLVNYTKDISSKNTTKGDTVILRLTFRL